MQAVALAVARGPATPQRAPLGLAQVGEIVQVVGDLAGISTRTACGSFVATIAGRSGWLGSRPATAVRMATRLT